MSKLSRRTFLTTTVVGSAASAIPLPVWMERSWGQAGPARTRCDIRSPVGAAMLRKYANAVRKMNDLAQVPLSDPKSWTFQWYTHAVKTDLNSPGNDLKPVELNRIYPAPTQQRQWAQEVWDTCTAHRHPPNFPPLSQQSKDNFLSWHRAYLLYFEEMIRNVLGDPTFTMPYWDYGPNTPQARTLPAEFRQPNDAVFGSLFRDKRNGGVNDGVRIDRIANVGLPPNLPPSVDILPPTALQERTFRGTTGANGASTPGFTEALRSNPHDPVHGLIGNPQQGMGSVPWAANDPIFWLHHCNLDRLWESWNAGGGQNPCLGDPWRSDKFAFVAPDGSGTKRVEVTNDQVERVTKLNYNYDRLENGPTNPVPCPSPVAGETVVSTVLLAVAPLSGQSALLVAAPGAGGGDVAILPGKQIIDAAVAGKNVYLVIDNARSNAPSSTFYHTFLEASASGNTGAISQYVGSFNFFEQVPHADHGGDVGPGGTQRSLSLTAAARALRETGVPGDAALSVKILPSTNDAPPVSGEIKIVAQDA